MDLWIPREHITQFHNLVTWGKSTLGCYSIMAHNQNLYSEIVWIQHKNANHHISQNGEL